MPSSSDGPATLTDRVDRASTDRLVELQVLAANGDLEAAAVAGEWLAHDPRACRTWHTILVRCQQAGGSPRVAD